MLRAIGLQHRNPLLKPITPRAVHLRHDVGGGKSVSSRCALVHRQRDQLVKVAAHQQLIAHQFVGKHVVTKRLKIMHGVAHTDYAVSHRRITGKLAASVKPRHVRIGTPRLRCVEKCSRIQRASPR